MRRINKSKKVQEGFKNEDSRKSVKFQALRRLKKDYKVFRMFKIVLVGSRRYKVPKGLLMCKKVQEGLKRNIKVKKVQYGSRLLRRLLKLKKFQTRSRRLQKLSILRNNLNVNTSSIYI